MGKALIISNQETSGRKEGKWFMRFSICSNYWWCNWKRDSELVIKVSLYLLVVLYWDWH